MLFIFALFLSLEGAEGFAGGMGAVSVSGIEDAAKFVAGEAVELGVIGVQFGPQDGSGRPSSRLKGGSGMPSFAISAHSGGSHLCPPIAAGCVARDLLADSRIKI